jgi:hypothetical protein
MIALGNIIEFAVALDYRTHEHIEVHDGEYLEREAAMTHYRTLIAWFSNRYGVIIAGSWVNPSYLFKRQLISFGASLGDYFTRKHSTVQQHDKMVGITPVGVKRVIRHHIQTSWANLLPAFDQLVDKPSQFLHYTGPAFRIIRKTPFRLAEENLLDCTEDLDFDAAPIYLASQAPSNALIPDHPAEKRSTVVSPPSSPSRRKVLKKRKHVR